ncbi:hypothetical protein ACFLX7_05575 [Chloroflexota bacterium]
MSYWLSVHHPREIINESFQTQCNVYVQKKTELYKDKIHDRDICFIYETTKPNRIVKLKEGNGSSRVVNLRQGAKSMIAMVRIDGEFEERKHFWDEDEYIGLFRTEILEVSRISYSIINQEFKNNGIDSKFVVFVNGGIKPVEERKAKILIQLMRTDLSDWPQVHLF